MSDVIVKDVNRIGVGLTNDQLRILFMILKMNKDGTATVRATKPKDGRAAYVWRMVMFMASKKRAHQCIPVTADFGITDEHCAHRSEKYIPSGEVPPDWDNKVWDRMHRSAKKRAYIKEELDPIVDSVLSGVGNKNLHGVIAWGKAFGKL